jgi:porin
MQWSVGRVAVCACVIAAGSWISPPAHADDEDKPLTADWIVRKNLKRDAGIEYTLKYINEVLDVMSGGINRRASYEGRLEFSVDQDFETLGLPGVKTHFTIFQIHGTPNNAAANVGSIADPSNIDALRTTRLFTAWVQYGAPEKSTDPKKPSDRFSIRVGQLAADDEFITSPTAGGLINGTFGWAGILAANIRNGGPAYPLAVPGARVQVRPVEDIAIRAAVFSGDPAGRDCFDLAQICNNHGTTFSFAGGALLIAEAEYSNDAAGTYKLGAWYATTDYADQRFGLNGAGMPVSLANPAAVGPLNHSGNWGVYGVFDKTIGKTSFFTRAGAVPSDRNLLSFYIDGGIAFKGLLPTRDNDTLTFGAAYEKISANAIALDRDTLAFAGPPFPIRSEEVVFEVSYQFKATPWWIIQPDFQYIVHPGGNVPDPNNPNVTVKNAAVIGVRSTINF